MVLNIELLDGAIVEHDGSFYVALVEENRLTIQELFTGLRASDSEQEKAVLITLFETIKQQSISTPE